MTNENDGRTVWIAVAAALALGVVFLTWRDHQLSGRVADLEQRLDDMRQARETLRAGGGPRREGGQSDRSVRDRTRGRRSRGDTEVAEVGGEMAEAQLAERLASPAARQLVEGMVADYSDAERSERRQRRGEFITARVQEVLEEFADEQELDEETRAKVVAEVQAMTDEMMSMHDALLDGEVERDEAMQERERLRQESDVRLIELLGPEGFDALEQAMEETRGHGR